jgi:hypothetical protein
MAWYAENRERRQAAMRAYVKAQTMLAQRYPDERRQAYADARQAGATSHKAGADAYAAVRKAHLPEFRMLLTGLRSPS